MTFEPKPRFRGAPPTCNATGLLAFKDRASIKSFLDQTMGSVLESWTCHHCRLIHFWPSNHHHKDNQTQEVPVHIAKLILKAL